MKIEVTHRFTATHCHLVPPGEMSKPHPHDWALTVWLEGKLDPKYRWVADYREVHALMEVATSRSTHYEMTTEQLLIHLVHEVSWGLPNGGPVVASARLAESDDDAAFVAFKPLQRPPFTAAEHQRAESLRARGATYQRAVERMQAWACELERLAGEVVPIEHARTT